MLCRACEAQTLTVEERGRTPDIGPRATQPYRVSDQLCARCGDLVGRDEIERHARKKESQLEKFGLGRRRLLLGPKDTPD